MYLIAQDAPGNVTITAPDGQKTVVKVDVGSNGVYKGYVKKTGAAGSVVISTVPVWSSVECSASHDEQVLYGDFVVTRSLKTAVCHHTGSGGQHTCQCPLGYSGDGKKTGSGCKNIDGCATLKCAVIKAGGVGTAPTCVDALPPFDGATCTPCPTGYNQKTITLPTGVQQCVDTDACTGTSCYGGKAKCTDKKAPSTGFTCASCPAGTSGTGIGQAGCKDIDDCANNGCGANAASCKDTGLLRRECNCITGYSNGGTNTLPVCVHTNACASGENDCKRGQALLAGKPYKIFVTRATNDWGTVVCIGAGTTIKYNGVVVKTCVSGGEFDTRQVKTGDVFSSTKPIYGSIDVGSSTHAMVPCARPTPYSYI